jgi:hypothetical protein
MKRKATMLFAVAMASAAGTAAADPKLPVQRPRTLWLGQPACGNVMFKSYSAPIQNPVCPTFRAILALVREGQRIQRDLPFLREFAAPEAAELTDPLTLAMALPNT